MFPEDPHVRGTPVSSHHRYQVPLYLSPHVQVAFLMSRKSPVATKEQAKTRRVEPVLLELLARVGEFVALISSNAAVVDAAIAGITT